MDPLAASILQRCKIDPTFRSLGSLTRSARGVSPGTDRFTRSRRGSTIYPFLSKVANMHYSFAEDRMEMLDAAGLDKLAAFFQKEPKVLLSRSIGVHNRFQAGYLEDRMAVGRGLIILTPRSMDVDAMYLLGLLASRLYSFLYTHYYSITYKGERKIIKLTDLRRLPVPVDHPIEKGLINGLVIKILNLKNIDPRSPTMELERAIDSIVYRLFKIGAHERARIEMNSVLHSEHFQRLDGAPPLRQGDMLRGADPVAGEAAVEE